MKASHNYGALAVWAGGGPKHVQQVRYRVTEELVALWGGRGEGGKILKSNQGGQSQCRRGSQMEEQRKEMSKNLGRKNNSHGYQQAPEEGDGQHWDGRGGERGGREICTNPQPGPLLLPRPEQPYLVELWFDEKPNCCHTKPYHTSATSPRRPRIGTLSLTSKGSRLDTCFRLQPTADLSPGLESERRLGPASDNLADKYEWSLLGKSTWWQSPRQSEGSERGSQDL